MTVKTNYILCWAAYIALMLLCLFGIFVSTFCFTEGKAIILGILLVIGSIWSIVVNTMKLIDVCFTYKIWKKRQN